MPHPPPQCLHHHHVSEEFPARRTMPSSSSSSSSAADAYEPGNAAEADCIPGLPPGFRFAPTDSDMVWLLREKMTGPPPTACAAYEYYHPRDIDVSLFEPEELPRKKHAHREHWSFFFTTRTNEDPNGDQPVRPTPNGCWKGTGNVREIWDGYSGRILGFKKMFDYYKGKGPNEVKTSWMMKEVRMNPHLEDHRSCDLHKMETCVFCKVYDYRLEEELEGEWYYKDAETSEEEE